MEIIPAIDLNEGHAVRLYQGDFAQTTVYDLDPAVAAERWYTQGAQRLHLVDLDGARAGHPVNSAAIRAIVQSVPIPVQLGGGLRTETDIDTALELGVQRVILGTVAVRDPSLVARAVARFGDAIIVGVDARDGKVATSAWTEQQEVRVADLVRRMADMGVRRIISTDIGRDGTLTEPNYDATAALVWPGGPAIIASGGVSHISHVERLATLGIEGAIVGRALYTGAFDLAAALQRLAASAL